MRGKVIWITGATGGLGKAMAMECASQGAELILTARRKSILEDVAKACKEAGSPQVYTAILDMEQSAQIEQVAQSVLQRFPRIDILINNAGISQRSLIKDTEMEVYRRVMEIDYMGPVHLTKLLLTRFSAQKSGHVVVISSLVGKFATPLRSGYAAAKHALHGFFDTLRMEHYEDNIKVTLICPGFIKTDVSINALTAKGEKQNKMDKAQEGGMLPATFAAKAIKGIKQGKEELLIGGKEKNGVLLHRLFPKAFRNYLRKAAVT